MADSIGESGWKAFTKKQKLELDDAAFLKALARFDKTDASKPAPRAEALDDVIEQGTKLVAALARKKKELGDKPFNEAKDKLHAFVESAQRLLKDAKAAAEPAAEEEDSPALLNAKMVPLIRELRKGGVTMHALIATAGKNTAVLVMRHAIAPNRRPLLAEAVDAKGGTKFIPGEATLEDRVLTFVVQSPAAGLAKRIRQALHLQTELRLKVRVRGEGGESDEDGADEEDATQAPAPAPGDTGSQAQGQPSDAERAYREREAGLAGPLEAALAALHPEATRLRALSGFASEKAAAGSFAAALQALDMLEATLAKPAGTASGSTFSKVAFEQVHLRWDANKKAVQERLDALRRAILEDADDAEPSQAVNKLDRVLAGFNLGLGDKIDDLRNADSPAARQTLAGDARRIAATYLAYLEGDALVRHVEANPYQVSIGTHELLGEPLHQLQAELDKIGL